MHALCKPVSTHAIKPRVPLQHEYVAEPPQERAGQQQ